LRDQGSVIDVSNTNPEDDGTSGAAQSLCQRKRKLRVDEKKQSLFRRDDGMVRLTSGKGQDRIDIRAFEIWILLQDRFSRLASRQQAWDVRNGNAQIANARTTMHAVWVNRNSFQKI
jgi:hypothetical protein